MSSDSPSIPGVLRVISGADKGRQCSLSSAKTTVGRGMDQALVLADLAVSRRHFVILAEGTRYRLNDLGSGNGTLVNGVRQASVLLGDGDTIEIGATTLRFEHAASQPAPVVQKTMIDESAFPPPPVFPPPIVEPTFPPPMLEQGGGSMTGSARPMRASGPASPVEGTMTRAKPGLLNTSLKKGIFFGGVGLIVLLGGVLAMQRLFFNDAAEAQKLFAGGTRSFSEGDYSGAKRAFVEALAKDPELTQAGKYLKQCDVEIHARGALKTANGLITAKRWHDALKTLESIDKSSDAYKQADDLRRQAIPWAIRAFLDEAKELMKDDPEGAQSRIEQALGLDPESEVALALERQLKEQQGEGGEKPAPAETVERPTRSQASRTEKRSHQASEARDDWRAPRQRREVVEEDLAPLSPRPSASATSAGGSDLLSTRAAAPYRSRDFAAAAQALRSEGRGKAFDSLALQVTSLGSHYAAAESQKGSNLQGAINEYQQALLIDARIGKATHSSYFRSQLGRLSKQLAMQAFQQQRYDVAFEAAKGCTRYGSDDGGVLAQLKAKAAELCNRATSMQRSNLNEAKRLWRMVVRMVPASDPSFERATSGLASSTTPSRGDEDE